jgi:hypothetical protein
MGDFSSWSDGERIVVNVHTLYREFAGDSKLPEIAELFAEMARFRRGH